MQWERERTKAAPRAARGSSILLFGTGEAQPLERREARGSGVADGGRTAALPARQAARWTRASAKTTPAPMLLAGGYWPGVNVHSINCAQIRLYGPLHSLAALSCDGHIRATPGNRAAGFRRLLLDASIVLPIPSRTFPHKWPVTYPPMIASSSFLPSLPLLQSKTPPKLTVCSPGCLAHAIRYTQGLASRLCCPHLVGREDTSSYGRRPNTIDMLCLAPATRNSQPATPAVVCN